MAEPPSEPTVPKPNEVYIANRRKKLQTHSSLKTKSRGIGAALPHDFNMTLAINGGGNHALSGGYGVMRGLAKKGVLNDFDAIAGVSGGFWVSAIYLFGHPDLEETEAQRALLDTDRDHEPEAISTVDLAKLSDKTMGYAAVRRFGGRECCELPWYGLAGCFSRCGIGSSNCHSLWVDAIHRTFLAPYGIKKNKVLAPSEADAKSLAAAADDEYLWPRLSGKSAANPTGEQRGPFPLGTFAMVMPIGVASNNGLDVLQKMGEEAAQGGLTAAIDAREKYHGVSPVPFFGTTAATGTMYQSVYVNAADGEMQGPTEMSFPDKQCGCCKPPAPVRFNSVATPPSQAVPKTLKRPCCWLPSANKMSLEVLTSFSSHFLAMYLNEWPGCISSMLNPFFGAITGRLSVNTAPKDASLAPGVRSEAMCDFADGGVVDTTGVAASIAAGGSRKIMTVTSPGTPFRPCPREIITAAMQASTAVRQKYSGRIASKAAEKEMRTEVLKSLKGYLDCVGPDGCPVTDFNLAALFGIFPASAVDRDPSGVMLYVTNQVFDSSRYPELLEKFSQLYDQGRPLVATIKDIQVIDNPFHGTFSTRSDGTPNTVDLTVIYYHLPGEHGYYKMKKSGQIGAWVQDDGFVEGSWAARVGPEVLKLGGENFPYLLTIGQNLSFSGGCKIDAYSKEQVNLYGYLGDFIVQDAWEEVLEPFFSS